MLCQQEGLNRQLWLQSQRKDAERTEQPENELEWNVKRNTDIAQERSKMLSLENNEAKYEKKAVSRSKNEETKQEGKFGSESRSLLLIQLLSSSDSERRL